MERDRDPGTRILKAVWQHTAFIDFVDCCIDFSASNERGGVILLEKERFV